jgi:hypothetical protein
MHRFFHSFVFVKYVCDFWIGPEALKKVPYRVIFNAVIKFFIHKFDTDVKLNLNLRAAKKNCMQLASKISFFFTRRILLVKKSIIFTCYINKIRAKHCFWNKVFSLRGRGRDKRITFLVSVIQLQKADVFVLILWFKLTFCENGAFIFEFE